MATTAARARDGGTPPPIIAKAGRYTVFLTPPAIGKSKLPSSPEATSATKLKTPVSFAPNRAPSVTKLKSQSSPSSSQATSAPAPSLAKPASAPAPKPPTIPVQVPPPQFSRRGKDQRKLRVNRGAFEFFRDAVAKVQDAHASLDQHLAEWFGLNHSKYQWALDDYYESRGMVSGIPLFSYPEKGSGKLNERVGEGQSM